MYKVIKFFTDLQDNDHPYDVGEPFPREGVEVSEERFAELLGSKNKRGEPLIEKHTEAAKSSEDAESSETEKPTTNKKRAKGTVK